MLLAHFNHGIFKFKNFSLSILVKQLNLIQSLKRLNRLNFIRSKPLKRSTVVYIYDISVDVHFLQCLGLCVCVCLAVPVAGCRSSDNLGELQSSIEREREREEIGEREAIVVIWQQWEHFGQKQQWQHRPPSMPAPPLKTFLIFIPQWKNFHRNFISGDS